jgi:exonuclease 1
VAPYEADAQLAFLSLNGLVEAVISEDSDLLAYGCSRVLFKMDKFGNGKEVRFSRLHECQKPINYLHFDLKMFRHMCILSGCDYLPSVAGMGIRTAHSFIKTLKTGQRVSWILLMWILFSLFYVVY